MHSPLNGNFLIRSIFNYSRTYRIIGNKSDIALHWFAFSFPKGIKNNNQFHWKRLHWAKFQLHRLRFYGSLGLNFFLIWTIFIVRRTNVLGRCKMYTANFRLSRSTWYPFPIQFVTTISDQRFIQPAVMYSSYGELPWTWWLVQYRRSLSIGRLKIDRRRSDIWWPSNGAGLLDFDMNNKMGTGNICLYSYDGEINGIFKPSIFSVRQISMWKIYVRHSATRKAQSTILLVAY